MKLIGKYMGDENDSLVCYNMYMGIDASFINVEAYNGISCSNDKRCTIKVRALYHILTIRKMGGVYLTPEEGNDLIKTIMSSVITDLTEFNACFSDVRDIRPDQVAVVNGYDEMYNTIPIEVTIKK